MTRSKNQAQHTAETLADPRWQAVRARDASADGSFYYSVRTSGVYCRPSCKARPARPENVDFHATAAAAEAAGFRPCKRCKPDAEQETIRYAIGPSALGTMLLAVSQQGVCALLLGDNVVELTADLKHRFPKARLLAENAGLQDHYAKAAALIADPASSFTLPLDLRGTDFQHQVWRALQQVPAGKTASYGEIARRIQAPQAVRAVAAACGANAVAVAIPCHRVLRGDGTLSGYRWGVARKEKLLAREARH
jgi:AraC family transcriptional regulator, regulatory protein of adaptative response / methylated-DNA-[protein]-cysteine methyltransferase